MKYIDYVAIENFKGFKNPVRIHLDDPAVLAGPNNAGKTTVLQALSLWSRAIDAWISKKGAGHQKAQRDAVGINRMTILDIPVRETKFFWNGVRVREGAQNIYFTIEVGVFCKGVVKPVKMLFNYRDQESLYSKPDYSCMGDDELLTMAQGIRFNLLYPMSGIAAGASQMTEEALYPEGRINVLLGEGQTALVLRNLCYVVSRTNTQGWLRVKTLIKRTFSIDLEEPEYDETRGSLALSYRQPDIDSSLDIALSGRGVQQLLLILAYLFSHSGSVLMIDEPDAHLEILRQKQIFTILKSASEETRCQILVATHSEVILDEAVATNLTSIVNGVATELSSQDLKTVLKSLGVEHYYNAVVAKRLLVVEGSTDVDMLRAFARKLQHPALVVLEGRLFTRYTQDNHPEHTMEGELDRVAGEELDFRKYFQILHQLVPDLKGVAILDRDDRVPNEEFNMDGLSIRRWNRYELENYFITPELIKRFLNNRFGAEENLFTPSVRKMVDKAVDGALASILFDGELSKVHEYYDASPIVKAKLLEKEKMSAFADDAFMRYAHLSGESIALNKGHYYKLIDLLTPDDIPSEITEKLDFIEAVFESKME